ncbi:unnamed protein product, partial [Allacma fusca]
RPSQDCLETSYLRNYILGTDSFIHANKGAEKAANSKTSEFELTDIEVPDLPTSFAEPNSEATTDFVVGPEIGAEANVFTVTEDTYLNTNTPDNNCIDNDHQTLQEVIASLERLGDRFEKFRSEFQNFEKIALGKLSKEFEHISLTLGRSLMTPLTVEDLGLPLGVGLPLADGKSFAVLQHWLQSPENQNKLSNYLKESDSIIHELETKFRIHLTN